jgi:hypothetical protein
LRQPILYAEVMWRRQRLWPVLLVGAGLVFSVITLYGRHWVIDANSAVWLLYIPCGLLFAGALLVYRRRNYAQITDAGLRISNLLGNIVIGYDQIRNTRVQPLERHFQDGRSRLLRPGVRELKQQPALFLRLKADEPELARIRKKLGGQLAYEDTVALPLPDPDAMAWEVSSRLPERTTANLGGGKRRRRRGR